MDKLTEKSNKSILSVQYPYQRDVIGNINWEWRMNGIIGARDITGSYLFQDDIETGHGNRIPLWLLGFLY